MAAAIPSPPGVYDAQGDGVSTDTHRSQGDNEITLSSGSLRTPLNARVAALSDSSYLIMVGALLASWRLSADTRTGRATTMTELLPAEAAVMVAILCTSGLLANIGPSR